MNFGAKVLTTKTQLVYEEMMWAICGRGFISRLIVRYTCWRLLILWAGTLGRNNALSATEFPSFHSLHNTNKRYQVTQLSYRPNISRKSA
jgi:hypothetical protein